MSKNWIRVQQTGSPIRRHHSQRETLIGLGLNRIRRVKTLPDNSATRGMIAKVRHLVRILPPATDNEEHSFDFLSEREAVFCEAIVRELADVPWARPLIDDINGTGGLTGANKAKLFELRFGYALHQAGITPRYEVPGEGESTLDFGFTAGGREFLVELMRLEETDAVQAATHARTDEDGIVWVNRMLTTDADDPRQSTEGETVKAVQRICQKFERDGRPHKFPTPGAAIHVLLVDFRTFMNGGDIHDRLHVGWGGEYVHKWFRLFWKETLISGVFSPRTKVKGAQTARERLHFLGFVDEKSYEAGTFGRWIQFIGNPYLFRTAEEARAAMAEWPLPPADILNAREQNVRAAVRPAT